MAMHRISNIAPFVVGNCSRKKLFKSHAPFVMRLTLQRSLQTHSSKKPSHSVPNNRTPMEAISKWTKGWFKGVKGCPTFPVNGENISVLSEPSQFYNELKDRIQSANHRVVLASLYLGNGELENDLVNCLYSRLQDSQITNPEFSVRVLVDYTRGSRGKINSRTLLQPLIRDFPNQTKVSLYHTPNLRGLLKAFIPERFNETIGVTHLKVYLFDDCLIMSGANLSNDYFTDRQDRYVMIEDCKTLCDYFEDLIETVSKFSLQLTKDDSTEVLNGCKVHPFQSARRRFIRYAKGLMKTFIKKYENKALSENTLLSIDDLTPSLLTYENYDNSHDTLNEESGSQVKGSSKTDSVFEGCCNKCHDTLIIPLLQMYDLNLRQDEKCTANLFRTAPNDINFVLATAYFNLTKRYWNIIRRSAAEYTIIMAHPEAMGFFNAPGVAGGVPSAYTHISKHFYKDIVKDKQTEQIVFSEYLKPGWTFHGKGLWAELGNYPSFPFLTLVGSPNFGYRSVYRDLEAQLLIITKNENLKDRLRQERDRFINDSRHINERTYASEDRNTPFWVILVVTFMRSFF